jgi:predicted Fe-S protein YdhL (DUF1289 family)
MDTSPQMIEQAVKSPCINICELENDDVCKGCYRSLEEIASWGYASIEERTRIISKAKQRQVSENNG